MISAFPDLKIDVQSLLAEGDRVAARWSWSGTQTGELAGEQPLPPTGKTVDVNMFSIHRVAGDRVAESWVAFDAMGMLQQLGVIPTPE